MPRTNRPRRTATRFELSTPSHEDSTIVRQFMEQLRSRPPRNFNRGHVVLNRIQIEKILANRNVTTHFPSEFTRRLRTAMQTEGKLFRLTDQQKMTLCTALYYAKCDHDLCPLLTRLCDSLQ